jgi:hypothetical protein
MFGCEIIWREGKIQVCRLKVHHERINQHASILKCFEIGAPHFLLMRLFPDWQIAKKKKKKKSSARPQRRTSESPAAHRSQVGYEQCVRHLRGPRVARLHRGSICGFQEMAQAAKSGKGPPHP